MNVFKVENNPEDMGSFLRNLRKNKKLTQHDVAIKMDTTSSAIARLESGGGKRKHTPWASTLQKYFNALGFDFYISVQEKGTFPVNAGE